MLICTSAAAQDAGQEADRVYGLDQTLCNGKKYSYKAPAGTKGNPYFLSPIFLDGTVTLRGNCYREVFLNYDIYNQLLLLRYKDETGSATTIEVSKAWLTSFSLGEKHFEYLDLEKQPRFFQVMGSGPLRILYHWRKTLDVDVAIGTNYLLFSGAIRDPYVLMDGQLKPFNTKRSLIRLFDPSLKPEIKTYIRKNKVRMKKASDREMEALIMHIGKLR
jgi:hypothetical protein